MKIYTDVPIPTRRHTATRCDACGRTDNQDPALPTYIEVTIAVGEHEDGGKADHYDYCEPCFNLRTPLLAAAGSTAPIVTGEWTTDD